MTLMYTYKTETKYGELLSNRWGTLRAIRERFEGKVNIVDAPPVEVADADLCPLWPGFARKGWRPR